jgi:glycerol kinase
MAAWRSSRLGGLGAPHWRPDARGAITRLELRRQPAPTSFAPALEAMGATRATSLMTAFAADGAGWGVLKIDGGTGRH